MKISLFLIIVIVLPACGTLTTVTNSEADIAYKLRQQQSYCDAITRPYSGVAFNFCKLHSNPNRTYIDGFLGFYVIDTVVSAVTDTVVLPYTVYQQNERGSIRLGPS